MLFQKFMITIQINYQGLFKFTQNFSVSIATILKSNWVMIRLFFSETWLITKNFHVPLEQSTHLNSKLNFGIGTHLYSEKYQIFTLYYWINWKKTIGNISNFYIIDTLLLTIKDIVEGLLVSDRLTLFFIELQSINLY